MKYIYDNNIIKTNIIILSQEFNIVYEIEIILYFYNKKEPYYFSKYYVIS